MKFIDVAEISVKAGDGGPGMCHFRREKYVPFGGPDGGNGGDGGNVLFEADHNMTTLLDFRYKRHYEADNGGKGGCSRRTGHRGEACVLKVPPGTCVYDEDTQEIIGELLENGQQLVVAKGGMGGKGNSNFPSSRNQAPLKVLDPLPGEKRTLRLELKVLADVGIVGAPNAGKSTLVSAISAARPKVADYPFTTMVPHLGVVQFKNARPFVVADVPGLIEGASEGKGLGHEFLRHIERTRVLIHMVDVSQETFEAMKHDYTMILDELFSYDKELIQRPRITVLSKMDALQNKEAFQEFCSFLQSQEVSYKEVSVAERQGLSELLENVVLILSKVLEASFLDKKVTGNPWDAPSYIGSEENGI